MSELARSLVPIVAALLREPEIAAALREVLAAPAALPVRDVDALVAGPELDRLLAISSATRNRLAREGLPYVHVGSRRRYRPSECRSWLASRGKRPTTPTIPDPDEDPIDVSAVLQRAGLRSVRPVHTTP